MKKDFLLEILVQELPYKFVPDAIGQLKSSFEKLFKDNAVNYENIKVYATPRRLAVIAEGLDEKKDDTIKEIKGPVLSIAKDDKGGYSPAAIGFAKKNGVELSNLYEKDNYLYARIEVRGKSTAEIIKENAQSIILKLQGAHFMRWGNNSEKFSRPIENVLALFDDEILELNILNKKASNKTQGHRYSKNRQLTIDKIKNYTEILKSGNVIVNQDERKNLIINEARNCADKNNLEIKFDEMKELLEEITFITEFPRAVLCEFDKKYLEIPSIVTTTVMTSHQRYFPLWDKEGKLSNRFITIANYVGDDFSNIQKGNQRVITARLEDGEFFYREDTKTKLSDKLDNLKGMTFQKGLGSLFDKTQRLIKLSSKIADNLLIKDGREDILECALLSKCDLSTKLVFEFTELQGFIGENYALFDGVKENIAKGICEHYFPLSANGALPEGKEGMIVSVADKIDTICALFISTQENKKKRPTGSFDPLGARRAAIGVLRIIIENNLEIDLWDLIKYSLLLLSEEFSIELNEATIKEIGEFFIQRLMFMYEKEFDSMVINSISDFDALKNLKDFISRAKIITKYKNDTNFKLLQENASRVSKIIKNLTSDKVCENLFITDEEKVLYKAILNHLEDDKNLDKYIKSLNTLIEPTVNFFDKVLVMDKDEKIKNNRIALLNLLKEKFNKVCDFEKL